MKKKISLLCLIAMAAVPLFASDFIAEYVDGFLDVKNDGNWTEVYIGDTLPDDAVVKLYEESYAEIRTGNDTIKLSRPGTYELTKLLGAKNDVAASGMGSLFSGKFKALLRDDTAKTQTTVGGVRAAEAETVSVDWMSSENTEIIADGKTALENGSLDDAYGYFTDAYDFSADSYEESEALYFMGLTSAMKGNYDEALQSLGMAEVDEDYEFYTDFYLLKGQLLAESSAYEEAYTFLNKYNVSIGMQSPEKLQNLYFYLAVSANNTGKREAAAAALNKLIAVNYSSETAKSAREYKNKL